MLNTTYRLETISCLSCIQKIETMLKKTEGVSKSEVLYNSSRVRVEHDDSLVDAERISDLIEDLGYPVISFKSK